MSGSERKQQLNKRGTQWSQKRLVTDFLDQHSFFLVESLPLFQAWVFSNKTTPGLSRHHCQRTPCALSTFSVFHLSLSTSNVHLLGFSIFWPVLFTLYLHLDTSLSCRGQLTHSPVFQCCLLSPSGYMAFRVFARQIMLPSCHCGLLPATCLYLSLVWSPVASLDLLTRFDFLNMRANI